MKIKDQLTPEQSSRLIELGVDPSKASAYEVKEEAVTDKITIETKEPIFTLADLLSLLPKTINFGNRSCCRLKFQAIVSIHDGLSEVWQACYTHTSCKTNKEASELIDCLYELLIWCITNKYIKL